MKTFNQIILVEPHTIEHKVTTTVVNGFARVDQKSRLIGLKAVSDLLDTNKKVLIKKGDVVYFKEDVLMTSNWAKKKYKVMDEEQEFIIADTKEIVGFDTEKKND